MIPKLWWFRGNAELAIGIFPRDRFSNNLDDTPEFANTLMAGSLASVIPLEELNDDLQR